MGRFDNFLREGFVALAVSLQNVVKRYKRGREFVEVLHHLSLNVPEGDFLALYGTLRVRQDRI